MIEIRLSNKTKVKSYLVNFQVFRFDNLLHLLFELFYNNQVSNDEVDDIIYEHILSLGYENVNQISKTTKKELEKWYFEMLDRYQKDFDEEKQSYLLMAKIVNKELLVTIDNQLVDTQQAIVLKKDSAISFTDIDKINDIKFTII